MDFHDSIDINLNFLENIDIDKGVLQNIDIDEGAQNFIKSNIATMAE